jgi:hypothetical protein
MKAKAMTIVLLGLVLSCCAVIGFAYAQSATPAASGGAPVTPAPRPDLTTLVSFLAGLSVAAERLVEIIKGYVPWLNEPKVADGEEGRRKGTLQLLAVAAGVVTAWVAHYLDIFPTGMTSVGDSWWGTVGLGLLASGGSGLWNSALTYVIKVKDLKKEDVKSARKGGDGSGSAVNKP